MMKLEDKNLLAFIEAAIKRYEYYFDPDRITAKEIVKYIKKFESKIDDNVRPRGQFIDVSEELGPCIQIMCDKPLRVNHKVNDILLKEYDLFVMSDEESYIVYSNGTNEETAFIHKWSQDIRSKYDVVIPIILNAFNGIKWMTDDDEPYIDLEFTIDWSYDKLATDFDPFYIVSGAFEVLIRYSKYLSYDDINFTDFTEDLDNPVKTYVVSFTVPKQICQELNIDFEKYKQK